tara:strand:+ start:82 stop:972 length:891 start_codon:yes stop_codon:yes gene_type:complete
MANLIEKQIIKYVSPKTVKERRILSESFNIRCEKITTEDNKSFVAKYYVSKNNEFNSIESEKMSLTYLLNIFPHLFPKIKYGSADLLLTEFIQHDNIKHKNYQEVLANEILKLHYVSNDKYGFDFNAQIGGLSQSNKYENNWINFFREKRLNMIFEKINKSNPMPSVINKNIEMLLKDLENYLPKNPRISLLHGDLWSGNILFNNGKLAALIDPGIYFGHNELEIAYLRWFKFVDDKFLNHYSNFIKIDKNYFIYEPIYQLYYCLLNVYLWSRDYIVDTEVILNKIFQVQGLGSDK